MTLRARSWLTEYHRPSRTSDRGSAVGLLMQSSFLQMSSSFSDTFPRRAFSDRLVFPE